MEQKKMHKKSSAFLIKVFLIILVVVYVSYQIPNPIIPYGDITKYKDNQTNETSFNPRDVYDLPEDYWNKLGISPLLNLLLLGNPEYQICFKVSNLTEDQEVFVSYDKGEFFGVIDIKCFGLPNTNIEKTFDLSYNFQIKIPNLPNLPPVNKSDCLPGTIDEASHTCLTQQGIENKKTLVIQPPQISIYFELNKFSKIKKFLIILMISSLFIKETWEFFIFLGKKNI